MALSPKYYDLPVPSVLLDWILPPKFKILIRAALSTFQGFTRVDSWEDAVEKSTGYQSPNVVEPAFENAKILKERLKHSVEVTSRYQQVAAAFLYCVSEINLEDTKPLRVLDFGGGGGDYFYQLRKFAPSLALEWTVLETTRLASSMQQETQHLNENIKWIDSFEKTEDFYDVVLCSSVLQYVEKPFESLDVLVKKTNFVVMNRLPLFDVRSNFVALQKITTNGIKGSYPAHFFSQKVFFEQIERYGSVPMKWTVLEDQPVVGWKSRPNEGLILQIQVPSGDRQLIPDED